MAGGTISKTAHFALHRARPEPPASAGPGSERSQALFAVHEASMGAVVPKRWAKRAVTRNGIKRQIYNVSAAFEPHLSHTAHVVRLRSGFDKAKFVSAWSDALKAIVRTELQQLFTTVIPAKAGIQGSPEVRASANKTDALDPRLRGGDGSDGQQP